jgi:pyruvate-ferredoxin/flavodoxin oxidoreductase
MAVCSSGNSGAENAVLRSERMKSGTRSGARSGAKPAVKPGAKFGGSVAITDGNEVISRVAYKTNGGIVIYTITPSSPFGEESAKRAAAKEKNLYGIVPQVFMACDEAAAASFIQGLAAKGVGSATASSAQGILLMIPEMYNSAGQLLPVSFYIGARDVTRHSLTIFGGHSDVYAVRDTGVIILFARNAQELQDIGAIAERLKWEVSLPVAVAYDGFLTTHRQVQVRLLDDEFFWEFMPHQKMLDHKVRSLDPAHPTVWGTNENPDGYMQGGLAQRPHTLAVAEVLPKIMAEFAALTGRDYTPYQYTGHPEATDVIVAAGSSNATLGPTVEYLRQQEPGRRIGVVNARTFRPFLAADFVKTLPPTVERIAVLDRTMNHTAQDEPLCADVRAAVTKAAQGFVSMPSLPSLPLVSGGIYGLAGKDFHPGSVIEVFNHLDKIKETGEFWTGFTVGVVDDVMHTSLPLVEPPNIFAAKEVRQGRIVAFGSDGTVSMVKAAAKMYSQLPNPAREGEKLFIESHAEYDSKKAGGVTVSHFRVSVEPLEECFDVRTPDYVAVHHPALLYGRDRILDGVVEGGTLVINTGEKPERVFAQLPTEMQATIVQKKLKCFAVDAFKIAAEEGLGNKISMIMQRVLLDRFGMISADAADEAMETAIEKNFGRKGPEIVQRNIKAFRQAVAALQEIPVPDAVPDTVAVPTAAERQPAVDIRERPSFAEISVPLPDEAGFREQIQVAGLAGRGDEVPVSAYFDHARGGARPVNSWRGLKRSFATNLPTFLAHACTECGACVYLCPTGGALELAQLDSGQQRAVGDLPLSRVFRNTDDYTVDASGGDGLFNGLTVTEEKRAYGVAVDPNLCTGCGVCAESCDSDAILMQPTNSEYTKWLADRREILDECREAGGDVDLNLDISGKRLTQSEMEMLPNYLGTSGSCGGCYEPLYVSKFLQLYPHTVISNATGCSSIWGAQAYETPYSCDRQGYGPAWVNPLFENNAAVGGGLALGIAQETDQMHASGEHVLEALRTDPRLCDAAPAARLAQLMQDMHERSEESVKTLGDRFAAVDFVTDVQKVIGDVLQLPAIRKDKKLAMHLGLLESTVTNFLDKKTLIVGGDGWAFDIGLQMLIHVMQSKLDVVAMALVTDAYSNTGGQMSKATPKGMDAPFAPGGKTDQRFPLGISVAHGHNAFVGQVNLAYPNHLFSTYHRAASFKGPALLLCYVPCMTEQKFTAEAVPHQARRATTTRYWPLWTYDPGSGEWSIEGNPESRRGEAKNEGSFIDDFARHEGRFRSQFDKDGNPSALLLSQQEENFRIWEMLQKNSGVPSK